jgi:hypothetical protein
MYRNGRGWQDICKNIAAPMGFACRRKVHKHTFRRLKIRCFKTATTVRRTNLYFTFIITLAILFSALVEDSKKNPLPVDVGNS